MNAHDFYAFAGEHWAVAFCMLLGVIAAVVVIFSCLTELIAHMLRAVLILARGWPPEHLDANGRFEE